MLAISKESHTKVAGCGLRAAVCGRSAVVCGRLRSSAVVLFFVLARCLDLDCGCVSNKNRGWKKNGRRLAHGLWHIFSAVAQAAVQFVLVQFLLEKSHSWYFFRQT